MYTGPRLGLFASPGRDDDYVALPNGPAAMAAKQLSTRHLGKRALDVASGQESINRQSKTWRQSCLLLRPEWRHRTGILRLGARPRLARGRTRHVLPTCRSKRPPQDASMVGHC